LPARRARRDVARRAEERAPAIVLRGGRPFATLSQNGSGGTDHELCRHLCRLAGRSRGLLDAGRTGPRLGAAALESPVRRRRPVLRWFADGRINACWNAVDRHVAAGRGAQFAIIHDSPVTGVTHKITFAELKNRVASLAGALRAKGVEKGDRVIIYMPMVPEALEAMLACARIGAIHSVVFGGFAAHELAVRIDDAKPKCIIAASCGIEPGRIVHYKPLLDGALAQATHRPDFCVVFQREQEVAHMEEGRDDDWHAFQYGVEPAECVPVEGDHPAYILYTSGTTGQPKGVVRPTAGHLVALNWTMKNVYGVDPGEVFWAASDVGWVVGHSYICYGPLIHGNTTIVLRASRWARPMPARSGG
jgi:propionyl-CoA synthetase